MVNVLAEGTVLCVDGNNFTGNEIVRAGTEGNDKQTGGPNQFDARSRGRAGMPRLT